MIIMMMTTTIQFNYFLCNSNNNMSKTKRKKLEIWNIQRKIKQRKKKFLSTQAEKKIYTMIMMIMAKCWNVVKEKNRTAKNWWWWWSNRIYQILFLSLRNWMIFERYGWHTHTHKQWINNHQISSNWVQKKKIEIFCWIRISWWWW